MKRSTERVLTTHTGSLPRPDDLRDLLLSEEHHGPAFDTVAGRAVRDIVRKQTEAGIDVINDGEQAKVGFAVYVTERLSGFQGHSRRRPDNIESTMFPEYFQSRTNAIGGAIVLTCTGPIIWTGDAQVQRDIANLRAAVAGGDAGSETARLRMSRRTTVSRQDRDVFLTAASPGLVWYYQRNEYYPSHEAYIYAIAEAMKHEYDAIHRAGFILQLDCPDLAGGWNQPEFAGKSEDDFRRFAQLHVEALNHATRDIPPEDMRMHICWGNYEGPHVRDIPLARIVDILFSARPAALSFEGANPRHEHEWKVFENVKLPEGKIILPGVLDSTTNFVEHPELVAQRIVRYARLVGQENVIAGSDCGFATLTRTTLPIHPSVTWAKLRTMAEGAKLASQELWR